MKLYRKFRDKNLVVLGREVGYFGLVEMFACLIEQDKRAKEDFKRIGINSGDKFIEICTKYLK